jgi:hypothetical protein
MKEPSILSLCRVSFWLCSASEPSQALTAMSLVPEPRTAGPIFSQPPKHARSAQQDPHTPAVLALLLLAFPSPSTRLGCWQEVGRDRDQA